MTCKDPDGVSTYTNDVTCGPDSPERLQREDGAERSRRRSPRSGSENAEVRAPAGGVADSRSAESITGGSRSAKRLAFTHSGSRHDADCPLRMLRCPVVGPSCRRRRQTNSARAIEARHRHGDHRGDRQSESHGHAQARRYLSMEIETPPEMQGFKHCRGRRSGRRRISRPRRERPQAWRSCAASRADDRDSTEGAGTRLQKPARQQTLRFTVRAVDPKAPSLTVADLQGHVVTLCRSEPTRRNAQSRRHRRRDNFESLMISVSQPPK